MNTSTLLARLAVGALTRVGVAHVVLCPGSRSAPLAYELHRRAGRRDGSRTAPALHVRHDERVAAFTALGVGAARPSAPGAVVTTSGTAAANLHPAVLEAHHAGVPLVVVTADRPPALRGTWANQTSELQAGLFGGAVRARLDLSDTEAAADPDGALAAMLEVLLAALGGAGARPGPVHLDLGLTDPLVPDDEHDPGPDVGVAGGRRAAPVPARGGSLLDGDVVLEPGPRTVVLAGDRATPLAREVAEAYGWPLLAEPSSGARGGPLAVGPYRLLLELPEFGGAVERAVVLGRPTLSRPVTRLLARQGVDVVLVSPYEAWPEPGRPVRRLRSLGPPAAPARSDPWTARWVAAGAAAAAAVDRVLDARQPTGPLVAREVAAATGPDAVLVAAASNAVRDLDLAAHPPGPDGTATVLANRGLSGIDGTMSTAVGAGLHGGLVRVLVGDLAFLHDLNALLAGPAETRPRVQVVVVNDDGGGIFSLLEHGERARGGAARAETFERLFGTPHGADLAALCRGYGVPHVRVDDLAGLRAALRAPSDGFGVVEVRADRAGLRDLHAEVRAEVRAAVGAAVPAGEGQEVRNAVQ